MHNKDGMKKHSEYHPNTCPEVIKLISKCNLRN